jgi:signal peptidase I
MKKLLLALLTLLAVGAGVFMMLFQLFQHPSWSMQPTLAPGDFLIVYRYAYGDERGPKVGDIVVFRAPNTTNRLLVKRVIAVSGQTVQLRKKVVYVDGKALPKVALKGACRVADEHGKSARRLCYRETVGAVSYTIAEDATTPPTTGKKVKVPTGFVYVLGDHRDHSYDSAAFGPIVAGSITGRVSFY